jgi:hypothetical protein
MKRTDVLASLICQVNERKELDKERKILNDRRKQLLKEIDQNETILSEMSDEEVGKL